ncbi:Tetratricopeptide-like helical domain [Trinorchestia longiramus]|nr:Tetratricopeptide-like helical domain [Trinorchestia longiramus]
MAVRNLVEGQCGERNPLMRLTQHFTQDKALKDEGFQFDGSIHEPGVSAANNGVMYGASAAADLLLEEFMTETRHVATAAPQPFRMDSLLQEMREIEGNRAAPLRGPAVADLASSHAASLWTEEFLASEAQLRGEPSADGPEWEAVEADVSRSHHGLTSPDDVFAMGGFENSYHPHLSVLSHHPLQLPPYAFMPPGNGILKLVCVHVNSPKTCSIPQCPNVQQKGQHWLFEPMYMLPPGVLGGNIPAVVDQPSHPHLQLEQPLHSHYHHQQRQQQEPYDPKEDSELARTANELLGTVDDPKFSNTEFMQFISELSEGHESDASKDSTLKSKEDNHSRNRAAAATAISDTDKYSEIASGWLAEVEAMKGREADLEKSFVKRLDELGHQWTQDSQSYMEDFEPSALLQREFQPYKFVEDNPLASHPDPLAEGERCLAEGDLPSAVLLFEAAVQQQPQLPKAWYLLGQAHAENEQDEKALPALRKCVELDPTHDKAWMALATSYTNESEQTLACLALKSWLRCSSDYSSLVSDTEISNQPLASTLAPKSLIEEVQSLYMKAANQRATIDPAVQGGLGVLFNIVGDYDKAVDCFNTALSADPEDSRLWNKLGATLANSSRSDEAVCAYERALQLSPGFIRCRYNLGIACINLKSHREAVQHFLSALNMQAAGRGLEERFSRNAVSDNLWSILRVCLPPLNMTRLIPAVNNRDLDAINAAFDDTETS